MKNSFKTQIISYLTVFLFLFLLVSCKPTPEKPEVISKNNNTSQTTATVSGTASNYINNLSVPEDYQNSFSKYNNKLNVMINATIDFPEAQSYPIYAFSYKPFTQDQVDNIIMELIGNSDLYYTENQSTKSELEARLIDAEKALYDLKNGKKDPTSEGGSSIEDLENMIENFKKAIPLAPETHEKTKIPSKLYSEQSNTITATAYVEGKGDAEFSVYNELSASHLIFKVLPTYYQAGSSETDDLGLSITKDKAVEMAKKTAMDIGATYMQPVAVLLAQSGDFSSEDQAKAYTVIFTRQQDDLQGLYTGWDTSLDVNDQYNEHVQYELLKVIINRGC